MNKTWNMLALAGLLLIAATCAAACGSTPEPQPLLTGVHLQGQFRVPDEIEGQAPSHTEMNYLLWLPDGYEQAGDKQWPLIFFLHGAGSTENSSQFVMSSGLPGVLYKGEQPADFGFVVVSPQAFPNIPWWEGDTLAILDALLEEILNTYQVDPQRVYLTGLSMGGYGSWWLATAYPDRFAAMISVAGSGYRTLAPPDQETYCRLKDLPVWAIHGAQDTISDPMANKMQVFTLAECGGEVEWTLYPDADHGETYRQAYRDPELYTWMLQHAQPAE